MIRKEDIYGSKAVKLPTPHFVVFYNGKVKQPERKVMYLSNLYTKQTGEPGLELAVVQLNINICREGGQVSEGNEDRRGSRSICGRMYPGRDTGRIFSEKPGGQVVQMSIFEYDEEAHMRVIREEGREEGRGKVMFLVNRLLSENRLEDLRRATKDEEYMRSLIDEFESAEE